MYVTPELISYIREQLSAGFDRATLEPTLREAGWSAELIQDAFAQLVAEHKQPTPNLTPTPDQDINTDVHSKIFATPQESAKPEPISTELQQPISDSMDPVLPAEEPVAHLPMDPKPLVTKPENNHIDKKGFSWWQWVVVVIMIAIVVLLGYWIVVSLLGTETLLVDQPAFITHISDWVRGIVGK